MTRFVGLLVFVILLLGCQPRGSVLFDPAARNVGDVEHVFFGTTRLPDHTPGVYFGPARSVRPYFGRIDVSVPPNRKAGEITWPPTNGAPDPTREFLATEAVLYDSDAGFRTALAKYFRENPSTKGEVIIFIHGFNNNFAESSFRFAQLGHDFDFTAALIHYSWPSRAEVLGYAYDRDSALFARDGLARLISNVERAGARRVIIVAHSMGTLLTMETLRTIAASDEKSLLDRISGIVLLSPDIDVDVFRAQARDIGNLPQPFVIFVSKKDSALGISARLTGEQNRLGNLSDAKVLADLKVTIFDTTAFSVGGGHFDAGSSPALISLVEQIAGVYSSFENDPTVRTGLLHGAVLTMQNATEVVLTPAMRISEGRRR